MTRLIWWMVRVGGLSALLLGLAAQGPAVGVSKDGGRLRGMSATACPGVYFIGARGSGENRQLGPEVAKMASVAESVLASHRIAMKVVPDAYEAASVDVLKPSEAEILLFTTHPLLAAKYYYDNNVKDYLASITDGIAHAVLAAKDAVHSCPRALLIMAGYSQGAMVIHQAELQLAADRDTAVLRQIAATLLLGDGDRTANSLAREFGCARPSVPCAAASASCG
jgi:hypothetical protein